MDGARFDALAKRLAGGVSLRNVLRRLVGLTGAGVFALVGRSGANAQDCAGQVWYEVSEPAMTLAGKPLGQFNIDSHGHHRAQRNQELIPKAAAAHLRARHHEEDGEPPDMPVIREGEKRERNAQRTLARPRMEVKPDACRKEKKPQSDECEIRPARGAKRQCAERDKGDDGQSPDHSLRRLTDLRFSGVAREGDMVPHLRHGSAAGHVHCKR